MKSLRKVNFFKIRNRIHFPNHQTCRFSAARSERRILAALAIILSGKNSVFLNKLIMEAAHFFPFHIKSKTCSAFPCLGGPVVFPHVSRILFGRMISYLWLSHRIHWKCSSDPGPLASLWLLLVWSLLFVSEFIATGVVEIVEGEGRLTLIEKIHRRHPAARTSRNYVSEGFGLGY